MSVKGSAYIDRRKDKVQVKDNGIVKLLKISKTPLVDDENPQVPSTEDELNAQIAALETKLSFYESKGMLSKIDHDAYSAL